ncbi:MAG: hypothetical protein AAGI49_14190 [Bacteroidota bacterium]
MKLNHLLLLAVLLLAGFTTQAQSYAFGVKGGLTVGIQNWSGFEQDPLFKYHGIVYVESAPEDNAFALFAQAGYHVKGSAIRNRFASNIINNQIVRFTREFQFRNVSIAVGAKQKYQIGFNARTYYLFGIRGDYTINTNFGSFNESRAQFGLFYPLDDFVQRFTYGGILGGGFEFPFSELIGCIVELTINPDFSYAYRQPQIPNVVNPFTGNNTTLSERLIRNVAIELTVGMRFLHKIEYID